VSGLGTCAESGQTLAEPQERPAGDDLGAGLGQTLDGTKAVEVDEVNVAQVDHDLTEGRIGQQGFDGGGQIGRTGRIEVAVGDDNADG
jgi:hypothetical protein